MIRQRKQSYEKKQGDIAKWYNETYGAKVTQSTVSLSLSDQFTYLGTDTRKRTKLTAQRSSQADFPALESALFK